MTPTRRSVRRLAATVALAVVGTLAASPLAGPAAGDDAATASRRRGRHPGRLHRLRLRPVPRADPEGHEQVAAVLAVPGRGHLHLRHVARLPGAAEPDPDLDQHPARERLAAAADHAGPAGLLPAAVPALLRRREDRPDARRRQVVRRGARPGARRGLDDRGRRPGAGHPRREHAVVRPRGLRRHQHRLPRVGAAVPQRLDDPAARARLRLRRLLLRRVRPEGARRRPGRAARPDRAPGPDLDRAVGRQGRHVHVVPPRGRLAAGRTDEAVRRWS